MSRFHPRTRYIKDLRSCDSLRRQKSDMLIFIQNSLGILIRIVMSVPVL